MPTKRKTLTQDDLFKIGYVTDAVLSPSGALAAYVLAETRGKGEREKQVRSIWLVSTSGEGAPRRLTQGQGHSYHPRFRGEGELLFLSTRDKAPQIYALSLEGGEAERLTKVEQGVSLFEVAPDGGIALSATANEPAVSDDDVHVRIDRFWYRFDPIGGYVEDVQQAVYSLKGGTLKQVAEPAGIVLGLSISPDSRQIAVLRSGLRHQKIFEADLSLVNLRGRKKEHQLIKAFCMATVNWSRDGREIVCTGPGEDLARQTRLFVVDPQTGRVRDRTRTLDLMVGTGLQIHVPVQVASRIVATESAAYATVTRGGEVHVHKISTSGRRNAVQIGSGQSVAHLMDVRDGKLLITRQSINQPPVLCTVDEQTSEVVELTHHNERLSASLRWPDVERLTVKSGRHTAIEGWVLKPKNAHAPYKTVLTIHGGPHAGYGCAFWADMHELVGAGYAIAFMNPRGSTGYGDDFCRAILGRWGELEIKDFNAFLDELVKLGIAHPDKLGVTGISGGGHLSAWLIGHTDRFKAAVPEQGVYSMISMWGTSDAGRDLLELELGGTLHKKAETYWRLSPLAHAHKCRTPTLLLQGENDIRCPMEQAEQLYAKLHNDGCKVEFIPMKGCRHGEQVWGRPTLRRFRMNVLRDWFERYLS